ncbi:MAG TPA: RNA 2',3'-cyclic phosphodiesterase [Desulfomonilaceae bacterium]|nr:RNA 2',3'-cyclic phosphodiesterase [Desulfomonilaceae bacterium]
MKTEVRAFIAVELPREVKAFLSDLSISLKKCDADVKWVKPDGMHLTLKFLGNVPTDVLPNIKEKAAPVFAEQPALRLGIRHVGAFPALKRPRVVWAGCHDPEARLGRVAANLEHALVPLGFAKEKRAFNPHLTLGRVRSSERIGDLIRAIQDKVHVVGPDFVADHAVLFESILSPAGAQYVEIYRFDCKHD